MLNLDTYPIPEPSVVWRMVDDEAVLVLPKLGKVKVLNEVGARIWSLVDGRRSVNKIVEQICLEYQVEQCQAQMDVLEFLGELAKRGVIQILASPPFDK